MADPIVEQIAAEIATRIAEVTETNGFEQDLVPIRPEKVDYHDQAPVEYSVLINQGDEDKAERQANTLIEWNQPFALQAIVLDSDGTSGSVDTKRNRVRADIQKKLMEDPTRNSLARDTVIEPSTLFNDGEGFCGIQINIVVRYRTQIDDPYTLG